MASYTNAEYVAIISAFDVDLISSLDPKEFVDFGVMDSKKYAEKMFRIMDRQGLTNEQRTMVIVLATAVKNKKRILTAMKKFQGRPWYTAVKNFIANNCVQYTYEEDDETFSIVHVPSSVPFLASRIWLQMTPNPDVASFLKNLWAAQMNVSDNLLNRQRGWEENFWDTVVTKGGQKFENAKFNEDYWKTKSADKYLLLNADGSLFGSKEQTETKVPYELADIEAWLKTRVVPEDTEAVAGTSDKERKARKQTTR